jgi:dTDP-4-dehydrorhamnose reductase
VDARHPFWPRLIEAGVTEGQLDRLRTAAGAPDLLGINHYLTSERFLDHRIHHYPGQAPGGNGRDTYVDVEAVRVASLRNQVGVAKRLRELWDRYRLPIAITEVHHGCTREEQVRWLAEVWDAAETERARGADIRAVTLWALFGLVDWRSLLTRRDGIHEPGAFEVRSPEPRPTMVAKAAAALGRGEKLDHPILDQPGWWHRPGRTYARRKYQTLGVNSHEGSRPLLITGATGTLGQAFARICSHRGLPYVLTSRAELDICDQGSIEAAIDRYRPWALINAAGFVRTQEAEEMADECFRANVTGPELLAKACKLHGLPFVTFSSDRVFDGKLGRSYVEPDAPAPACAYGRSKAEGDARLLKLDGDALIVRSSAFFGPWDRYNFLSNTIERLERGEDIVASEKIFVSPTYVPDLVHASLDLLLDGEKGIWHLTNQGAVSWHDLALEVADMARVGAGRIRAAEDDETVDTSLTSKRGLLLRPLNQALSEFAAQSESLRKRA